jgi:integrase/recombinase XerD
MATKFKRAGIWYIKSNYTGSWKNYSCGKDVTAADADYLIKTKYTPLELNKKHQTTLRTVQIPAEQAITIYRDTILPRNVTGRDKAKNTIRREKTVIDNFTRWLEQSSLPCSYSSFTEETIKNYFDYLQAENKASKTRREERRILKGFFEWSIDAGYYDLDNPVESIVNPKKSNTRPRFYSEAELKLLFENSKQPYLNIFKFLYLTGLRVGELCNLERCDYIEDKDLILIRIIDGNKTKREETVPLNVSAKKILLEQRELSKQFDTEDSKKYWFVNTIGAQLDDANVYRALIRVQNKKNVQIKNASTHTLRHTCASHLVIRGVSLYVVKDILRHKSIKETEIYAHLSKEVIRNEIEKLSV